MPEPHTTSLDPTQVDARLDRRGWIVVAGTMVVTALLLLPGIGRHSLWRDEGFSASTVLRPWGSFLHIIRDHESNAVVYSVLLRAWSELGSSEGTLRALSALAVLASIPVVALLGAEIAGRRVGIVAALLLAFHGSVFAYGQMIRAYAFVVLFTLLATLFFVREVRRPSNRMLVGWIVASLLLCDTNVVAATLIVCQVASLVVLPSGQRRWRRRILGAGLVLGLTLPLGLLIASHDEGGLFEFNIGTFWDVLMVMTGRSGFVGIVGATVLGVLALRSTITVFRRGGAWFERWAHAMCIAWVAGPFVLAIVLSLVEPILTGRYMMISVPGVAVYGAMGLVDFLQSYSTSDGPGRLMRIGATTVVAVGCLAGVGYWLSGAEVEDWRGAAHHVFEEAQPGDEVLFANDSVRLFFEYYRTEGIDDPPTYPTPAYPPQPWGEYETGDHRYESFDRTLVEQVAGRADRIWVVIGRDHVHTDDVDEVLAILAPDFDVAESRRFNGRVDVVRYERRP